jgi:transposase
MPRAGPRKVHRYSDEFKRTAVRLSQQPGVQVQTVAAALEIHPFMLSKWRKELKDGRLKGRAKKAPPTGPAREIAQLQALERKYAALEEEHDLLKKAIRFWAARRASGSPSSTISSRSTKATTSPRSAAAMESRRVGSTRGADGKPARTRTRIAT